VLCDHITFTPHPLDTHHSLNWTEKPHCSLHPLVVKNIKNIIKTKKKTFPTKPAVVASSHGGRRDDTDRHTHIHTQTHMPGHYLSFNTYVLLLSPSHDYLSLLHMLSPHHSHTWVAYCGKMCSNVGSPTATATRTQTHTHTHIHKQGKLYRHSTVLNNVVTNESQTFKVASYDVYK
jgi:hypothetical protein